MGLNMPHGGDQTNICECMEAAVLALGIKAGSVSYDDLYFTSECLSEISKQNPDNKLL